MIRRRLIWFGLIEDLTELLNLGFEINLMAVELGLQLIKLLGLSTLAYESLLIIGLKGLENFIRFITLRIYCNLQYTIFFKNMRQFCKGLS